MYHEKKRAQQQKLKLEVGDLIRHKGRLVRVCEVLVQGHQEHTNCRGDRMPRRRAYVAANPVDQLTGQTLTRTRVAVCDNWTEV